MTLSALLIQLLNGLAGASSLFLVAAGLSLIFGVTRIVNFAHGSFMHAGRLPRLQPDRPPRRRPASVTGARCCSPRSRVGLLGALIEAALLRRLYRAPELLQLIATFGIVLIMRDAALHIWGAEDLLGPRAPGLDGAVVDPRPRRAAIRPVPDRLGPLVLAAAARRCSSARAGGCWCAPPRQDRDMTAALGVDQARLFSGVFFVGALLAGLAGALQLPREPANLNIDLSGHRRRLRGHRRRRPGQHLRRLHRCADHRRGQGAVHRHRRSTIFGRPWPCPSSPWWPSSWSWRWCSSCAPGGCSAGRLGDAAWPSCAHAAAAARRFALGVAAGAAAARRAALRRRRIHAGAADRHRALRAVRA